MIFTPEPEHWFKVREDGKWTVKVITSGTASGGEEGVLDVGGAAQEGVTLLAGEEVAGWTSARVDGGKLVIEWQGVRQGGAKVHLRNSKEVIRGMYHSTVEDLVRDVRGTRVFRKYPWYRVENTTGEAITLTTYSVTDFLFLVPAMTVEVKPGVSYVDASSGDTESEQAVFSMADGREFAKLIENSQAITLDSENFKQFPYYEIENMTGESVSLTTYWSTDFVYLVPAKTIVVEPGRSVVTASSRNIHEEQAVFTLPDGRDCRNLHLRAFDSIVLDTKHFR